MSLPSRPELGESVYLSYYRLVQAFGGPPSYFMNRAIFSVQPGRVPAGRLPETSV